MFLSPKLKQLHEISVPHGGTELVEFDPRELIPGAHSIKVEAIDHGSTASRAVSIDRVCGLFEKGTRSQF